jgi:polysaccharide pyruvyl transferase WcaK-like protein
MNDIILYGAFDRHNYGDLLFPLVMERILSQKFPSKIIVVAGLIDSDLSVFNALPTYSIKKAIKESKSEACIILAGGDVVNCDWLSAYSYLLSDFSFLIFERVLARYLPTFTEKLIKRRFGLKSHAPFNLTQGDLKSGMKVIYNSVGATSLSNIGKESALNILKALDFAQHLSVRDEFAIEQINRIGGNVEKSILYPDSATIMSSIFSNEEINKKSDQKVITLIDRFKGRYLVFQISSTRSNGIEVKLAESLSKIANEHNLAIIFIAIGNAAGHSDRHSVQKIKNNLNTNVEVAEYLDGGVFDIMNIIKNSKCFCGTSLHGLITSMSFHVPRVGLLPQLVKQRNYMATWDLPKMPSGVLPDELLKAVNQAMSHTRTELCEKEQFLTAKYLENFDKICLLLE